MEHVILAFLPFVKNYLVKIIPQDSLIFKQLTLIGFKIWALIQHKPLDSLTMGVYATEHCNLNCKGCTNFSPIAKEGFLNIQSYKNDIEILAELTENKLSAFVITGGEPLLHPDINDILNITRKYFLGSKICIITNGLLLLKMPDTFWTCCQKNEVAIYITRYPIKINLDLIKEKAKEHSVTLDIFGGSNKPVKLMHKIPLDLNGKQTLKSSYNICTEINNCQTMKDGKIYPCNPIARIDHFNKYFNKKLKISLEDVLELKNVKNIEQIYNFLCSPKSFCKYCNRKDAVFGISFGTSNKEITEWI
jgi:MoaA/NifB/PqqE/SkfB family radical SAM enzyme